MTLIGKPSTFKLAQAYLAMLGIRLANLHK